MNTPKLTTAQPESRDVQSRPHHEITNITAVQLKEISFCLKRIVT